MNRLGLNLSAPNEYMSPYQSELIPPGMFLYRIARTCVTVQSILNGDTILQDFYSTDWQNPDQTTRYWTGGNWIDPITGEIGNIRGFEHIEGRYAYILDRAHKPVGAHMWFLKNFPYNPVYSKKTYPHIPLISFWYDAYKVQTNTSAPPAIDVSGTYNFMFRGASDAGCRLRFNIIRQDGQVLFDRRFNVDSVLETFHETFTINDSMGKMLGIALYMEDGESVYIDKISCDRQDSRYGLHPKAFEALAACKPKVLRYWQEQMGNNFYGCMNGSFHSYKPTDINPGRKELPLKHFLDICGALDCESWICTPTVLYNSEMENFAALNPTYLEYGNESWGDNNPYSDPFAGASMAFDYPKVANRMLNLAEDVSSAVLVLNGHTKKSFSDSMLAQCPAADIQSVAPYYGDTGAQSKEDLAQYKDMLVYETQSHANVGSAFEFNAGMRNACALLIQMLRLQPEAACVFTAFQYREKADVPLWGIYRDTVTYRPRPIALAMQLLNDLLPADVTEVVDGHIYMVGDKLLLINPSAHYVPLETTRSIVDCLGIWGKPDEYGIGPMDNNETEIHVTIKNWDTPTTVLELQPLSIIVGTPVQKQQEEYTIQAPAGHRRYIIELTDEA